MLRLILLLVLGAVLAYISKYNSELVSVNLGTYVIADVPLFYVIIVSILIGLIFSYLVYLVDVLFTSWKIRGKNNKIKSAEQESLELAKRVHQLELENEKLKNGSRTQPDDSRAL